MRYGWHVGSSEEAAIYTLRLLGPGLVEGPNGPVDGRLARPRPLALLAVLAMAADRGCTRDRLVGLFWGETDERHARHSLSDVLHSIHRELGPAVTLAAGDVVLLNGAVIEADAVQFERALEQMDMGRAVALYAGPFLEGFHLSGSTAFTEWQETERRRLAARFAGALECLAHAAEGHRDLAGAARWWGRRLELDPYCTHAAIAMSQALAQSGERAEALGVLTRHSDTVRKELGVEPDGSVLRAIQHLSGAIPAGEPRRRPATGVDPQPPTAALPALPTRGRSVAEGVGAPVRRGRRGRYAVVVAAGVAIVAALGWGWFSWAGRRHTLIGQGTIERGDRVLLADTRNGTANSSLADVRDRDGARSALEFLGDGHHLRVFQALHGRLALDESPLGTELRWWPLQLLRYTGDTVRALRALRAWRARVGWDTVPPRARPYWILIPTLAEGGRVREARGMLDEWRTLVPDDPRHRSDGDWSLGAIALAEGRFDHAVAAFLAWNKAPFAEVIHRYNRGLIEAATALERAGRADTAIALYERALAIWTMDGIHYEATWYPLVLQRLGRLHESLGHIERATSYYGKFIELWKDADPDLQPRVSEARMTLARLTRSR